jgi:molybdopterin synthase sulfur carrier subunit
LARLRFFGPAREAAGTASEAVEEATLGEALDGARVRHGERFAFVLAGSRVWVNGQDSPLERRLEADDEVVVLPPVSGGS